MPDGAPDALKEEVALVGRDYDGETRLVDPDVIGLILMPREPTDAPPIYLKTRIVDRDNRFVFAHSEMVDHSVLDPRIRRVVG